MNIDRTNLLFIIDQIARAYPQAASCFIDTINRIQQPWRSITDTRKSLLTPGGWPIEFTFNFQKPGICFTAEAGTSYGAGDHKWKAIYEMTGMDTRDHSSLIAGLSRLNTQRFGCWLSSRHLGERHQFKTYQEIPVECPSRQKEHILAGLALNEDLGLIPLLVGLPVDGRGASEYYFRLSNVDNHVLESLLRLGGVPADLPFLLRQLSFLRDVPTDESARNIRLGTSIKVGEDTRPEVSFFAHAAELFGSNRTAISKLCMVAESQNGDTELYQHITASAIKRKPEFPIHSLVSLRFFRSGHFELAVGLSPW